MVFRESFSMKASADRSVSHHLPMELKIFAKPTYSQSMTAKWSLWKRLSLLTLQTPKSAILGLFTGCKSLHDRTVTKWALLWLVLFKLLTALNQTLSLSYSGPITSSRNIRGENACCILWVVMQPMCSIRQGYISSHRHSSVKNTDCKTSQAA